MKFLVLALCVCAASAASFGAYNPYKPNQPQQVAKAFAQTVASPFVAAAEVAGAAPVVAAEAAYKTAQAVVTAPVVAAKVAYDTSKNLYYGKEAEAPIVRSDSEVTNDGFNYYYETGNGIAAQSTGSTKKINNEDVLVVQGSYRYVAPDGTPVQFSYVADENGYQPQSDLLPVGPAIPEAIIRSLEYIRTHAKPEKY